MLEQGGPPPSPHTEDCSCPSRTLSAGSLEEESFLPRRDEQCSKTGATWSADVEEGPFIGVTIMSANPRCIFYMDSTIFMRTKLCVGNVPSLGTSVQ